MVWFRKNNAEKKIINLEQQITLLQTKIDRLESMLTNMRLEKHQNYQPLARWQPSASSIMHKRHDLIPTDNDNRFLYDKLVIEFKTFQLPQNETDLIIFYSKIPVDNRVFAIIHDEIAKEFKRMNVKIPFMVLGNELELANIKGSDLID
jgi:hypothetical protein